MPSRQLLNAYPILGTLHSTAQTFLPGFVANKLLIGFGQPGNPGLQLALTEALDLFTLMSILRGNFPGVPKLVELFGRLRSFFGGARPGMTTTRSICSNMNEFEKFVTFLTVLFTALGFDANALPDLVVAAKDLENLTTSDISSTLEKALIPALANTLESFSVAVRTWMPSFDTRPLEAIVLQKKFVDQATTAFIERGKLDLSFLDTPSLFAPLPQAQVRSPLPSENTRAPFAARASPSAGPTFSSNKKAKTNRFSDSRGGAPSPGSNSKPKHFTIQQCAVGRIVWWRSYFNASNATAAFARENPGIAVHDSMLPCLLASHNNPDRFMTFVPVDATDKETEALRKWYNAGRGQAFKIDKPSDFQ